MSSHLTRSEALAYWQDAADALRDANEELGAANGKLLKAMREIARHDLHVDYADCELRTIARRALRAVGEECTCLRVVDGLGEQTGKVRRDPRCPEHGAAVGEE